MEDVGRAPTDLAPAPLEPASIPTLDGWIESLMTCKQLAEVDVQRLCEKVRFDLPLYSKAAASAALRGRRRGRARPLPSPPRREWRADGRVPEFRTAY